MKSRRFGVYDTYPILRLFVFDRKLTKKTALRRKKALKMCEICPES